MFYSEKKLHTLKLLALSIFFSSAAFCAAEKDEPSPEELTRTYLKYLQLDDAVMDKTRALPIDSAKYGLAIIACLLKTTERLEHCKHVNAGPSYGCSFTAKNEPPIQFIVHAITGKKSWKKEMLESLDSSITIADVGCGLGFSTISVVLQTLEIYEKDSWELKAPIHIDLYDISPEHKEPLIALAALINMALPKYFKIKTFVHDAVQPFPEQNYYRLAMGFNFMHYVPQTNWALVLQNLENSMKKGGMLFLTADHYLCGLDKDDADHLESSIENYGSPFIIPTCLLFSKKGGKANGTQLTNLDLKAVLKEDKENTPGHQYSFNDIHRENFLELSKAMLQKKPTPSSSELTAKEIEMFSAGILRNLRLGELAIQLGCYRFNEELFESALGAYLGEESRLAKKELDWSKHLPKNSDGSPSSVGMTFIKG
ncbi:MAG: class I SAM-dependent methyltransferase [Proteobacteria bacterium]|nr:class I SAM-dependent methyltransferase [Pseudomonadota bacterium]